MTSPPGEPSAAAAVVAPRTIAVGLPTSPPHKQLKAARSSEQPSKAAGGSTTSNHRALEWLMLAQKRADALNSKLKAMKNWKIESSEAFVTGLRKRQDMGFAALMFGGWRRYTTSQKNRVEVYKRRRRLSHLKAIFTAWLSLCLRKKSLKRTAFVIAFRRDEFIFRRCFAHWKSIALQTGHMRISELQMSLQTISRQLADREAKAFDERTEFRVREETLLSELAEERASREKEVAKLKEEISHLRQELKKKRSAALKLEADIKESFTRGLEDSALHAPPQSPTNEAIESVALSVSAISLLHGGEPPKLARPPQRVQPTEREAAPSPRVAKRILGGRAKEAMDTDDDEMASPPKSSPSLTPAKQTAKRNKSSKKTPRTSLPSSPLLSQAKTPQEVKHSPKTGFLPSATPSPRRTTRSTLGRSAKRTTRIGSRQGSIMNGGKTVGTVDIHIVNDPNDTEGDNSSTNLPDSPLVGPSLHYAHRRELLPVEENAAEQADSYNYPSPSSTTMPTTSADRKLNQESVPRLPLPEELSSQDEERFGREHSEVVSAHGVSDGEGQPVSISNAEMPALFDAESIRREAQRLAEEALRNLENDGCDPQEQTDSSHEKTAGQSSSPKILPRLHSPKSVKLSINETPWYYRTLKASRGSDHYRTVLMQAIEKDPPQAMPLEMPPGTGGGGSSLPSLTALGDASRTSEVVPLFIRNEDLCFPWWWEQGQTSSLSADRVSYLESFFRRSLIVMGSDRINTSPQAIQIMRQLMGLWNAMAFAHFNHGDVEKGELLFERAVKLTMGMKDLEGGVLRAWALNNLSVCHTLKGHPQAASKCLVDACSGWGDDFFDDIFDRVTNFEKGKNTGVSARGISQEERAGAVAVATVFMNYAQTLSSKKTLSQAMSYSSKAVVLAIRAEAPKRFISLCQSRDARVRQLWERQEHAVSRF